MKTHIYIRLSLMMFLQYFIWGAWYVTVGIYMPEIGMDKSIWLAFTVGPIAALVSPFFLGMVADRYFATERVLGTLHLVGGVFMLCAPLVAEKTGSVTLFILADTIVWMIMTSIILHGICYDFFFVTGQIYVDRKSTPEIRGQAQGLLVMAMFGVGQLIGAWSTGKWFNYTIDLKSSAPQPWYTFWMAPAIFAAVVMFVFAIFFKNDVRSEAKGEA